MYIASKTGIIGLIKVDIDIFVSYVFLNKKLPISNSGQIII